MSASKFKKREQRKWWGNGKIKKDFPKLKVISLKMGNCL